MFDRRGKIEHHAGAGFGGRDADVTDFGGEAGPGSSREDREQAGITAKRFPKKSFSIMEFNA